MQTKTLGLIAGNGKFPIIFAQKAKQQEYRVIAAGIHGDTSKLLKMFVDQIRIFKVGELENLFKYFKEEGIQQVIMAGQVNPNNLFESNVNLDDEFQKLFEAMHDRKADTIFAAVADRLKSEGLELIDSTFLVKDYLSDRVTDPVTTKPPSERKAAPLTRSSPVGLLLNSLKFLFEQNK